MKIYLNNDEQYILEQKFKISGMKSKSSFIRHLILYGYVYDVDYEHLREYNTILARIGNNLNQIAKRMNATGNVYEADVKRSKGADETGMAITKIHAIKATVHKAVDYICDPAKTDESILISSFGCSPETAAYDFKFALSKTSQADTNKAFHLIQSFMPSEVSYKEAHQIGVELAGQTTGRKILIHCVHPH